jgi:oligoendopeptidase F
VGLHANVLTVLHESGHAFHAFEKLRLPYHQQRKVGAEFNEVASMAMELLAAPYLVADKGGFYDEQDAARARIEQLEGDLIFWPYMAVVDAFQHWVYGNPEAATDPANCDAQWAALWKRFIPAIDWSGLEDVMVTGWHRKRHIHRSPFYYVEYGMAQLCSVQIWAKALQDQAGAMNDYRRALALGGTVSLPDLYAAAGVDFAFDTDTMQRAVELMESTIDSLEQA